MIKAQIIIEMKDGALYSYANHFLEEKDDVVDRKGNYTFKGEQENIISSLGKIEKNIKTRMNQEWQKQIMNIF